MTNSLPDNLISRLTRVAIVNKTFTDDNGKTVEYPRLVLQTTIKGQDVEIETKIEQKNISLLKLADTEEERKALGVFANGEE
tara:strand:+ start:129 stop:374 length:246 start_codon:yes stop_codon:yes gene_type:complete